MQSQILEPDHGFDRLLQLFVDERGIHLRVLRQMHGLGRRRIHRADQVLVDLFGEERQGRRHHARHGCQNGVERLIGFVIARPEAAARPAQIPVGELLVEFLKRLDQAVVFEVLKCAVGRAHQALQAAQNPAVELVGHRGASAPGFQPSAVAYMTKKL